MEGPSSLRDIRILPGPAYLGLGRVWRVEEKRWVCRERDSDAAIGGLVRDRERERECGGLGWVEYLLLLL